MNRTFAFTTPRLVGALVLALGLLVAGLAVGLGPAGAVMDQGGDKPSVTEPVDISSAQTTAATSPGTGTGAGTVVEAWGCDGIDCWCDSTADCLEMLEYYPECTNWIFDADAVPPTMYCTLTYTETGDSGPASDDPPGPLGPGDVPGVEDTNEPTEPEQPENPENPEGPEGPEDGEEPPTGRPPRIDPGEVLDRKDLPGAADPGRTGGSSGRTGPDTPSRPLDPGAIDL